MTMLEQIVADAITAGRITEDDAAAILTFRDYLRDLRLREADPPAWLVIWGAYAGGLAEGPTTPEQFAAIRAQQRPEARG